MSNYCILRVPCAILAGLTALQQQALQDQRLELRGRVLDLRGVNPVQEFQNLDRATPAGGPRRWAVGGGQWAVGSGWRAVGGGQWVAGSGRRAVAGGRTHGRSHDRERRERTRGGGIKHDHPRKHARQRGSTRQRPRRGMRRGFGNARSADPAPAPTPLPQITSLGCLSRPEAGELRAAPPTPNRVQPTLADRTEVPHQRGLTTSVAGGRRCGGCELGWGSYRSLAVSEAATARACLAPSTTIPLTSLPINIASRWGVGGTKNRRVDC